ncbi:MAG: hypothetical protein IJN89_01695 [Anaerotignum sp.]|nr:hypothetical protein [Anaerotignum sp.]
MKKENNTGTFIVKIMNQQRSTWQGSVVWVEKQETQYFRSAHELIKMIDEAMGTNQNSEEEQA